MKMIKLGMVVLTLLLLIASVAVYILAGIYAVATKVVFFTAIAAIIGNVLLNREEFVSFFMKSRSITGFYKIIQFLIIIGIIVFVYLLSDSVAWKIDLTSSRLYSFSDETKKILKGITNDMNLYYFKAPFGTDPERDRQYKPIYDYQETLLKTYAEKNKHIKFQKIDPYQNRTLAYDYNIKEDATAVFDYEGNKAYVSLFKIFEMEKSSGKLVYKGEQAYTAAIKGLSASRSKNVYVLSGHGEFNPNDRGTGGFQSVFARLSEENVKLNQLDLLKFPTIPETCSLLIIGNPTHPLSVEEMDKIDNYIADGGSVMVLLEFETDPTINDILRQMGLFYIRNLAVDDQDFNPELGKTTIVPKILPSEITIPLLMNYLSVVMPTSVGIQVLGTNDRVTKDDYDIFPLLRTSKASFGETSRAEISAGKAVLDSKDLKGPLYTAFAVKRTKHSAVTTREGSETNSVESRMVVFGDSDFINNVHMQKYGNSDLFLNAVDYLLKRDADITVRPKTSEVNRIQFSGSDMRFLTVLIIAIVLAFIIPGIVIVLRRMKKVKGS